VKSTSRVRWAWECPTSVTSAKPKRINRWSKRLSPQQPQADESISQDFRISLVRPVYLLRCITLFAASTILFAAAMSNIRHCINRWGHTPAVDIRVLEVESWLKSLAKENGGDYEWSTVGKIRDAMSVVYQHAQRHELVPAGIEYNPARARKLGGPKIKTKSGYKAVRVTPMQIKKMLDFLPLLQRTMVILCALTAIRVSECVGLCWSAISWLEKKIWTKPLARRTLSRVRGRQFVWDDATAPLQVIICVCA
jgi:integrase